MLIPSRVHLRHRRMRRREKTSITVKRRPTWAAILVVAVIQPALLHPVSTSAVCVYLQLIFSISSSQEQVCNGSVFSSVCSLRFFRFTLSLSQHSSMHAVLSRGKKILSTRTWFREPVHRSALRSSIKVQPPWTSRRRGVCTKQ